MNRKRFGIAALVASATLLLSVSSCGHSRQLVSITVTPQGSSFNLTGFGQHLSTQFTAIGNFIHPPQSRDITTTVLWKSDSPDVVTVDPNQPGLVTTTGDACGTNLGISAIVYSNPQKPSAGTVVIGTATVTVTIPGCKP